MANITRKVFTGNGTFTPPAGVTRVRTILAPRNASAFAYVSDAGNRQCTQYLDAQGNIYASGSNANGEAGNNSATAAFSSPVQIAGPNKWQKLWTIQEGSSGNPTVFAQDIAGGIWAWGANANGQQGVGSITPHSSPVFIAPPASARFKNIIAFLSNNTASVLALDGLGRAWGWGSNTNSVLGTGSNQASTVAYSSPTAVIGGHSFVQLVISQPSSSLVGAVGVAFAIDTAGGLWAWGSNNNGITGTNTATTVVQLSSPTAVVGGISFASVFAVPMWTTNIAFGLDTSGNLWSWGANTNGQCGNNSATAAFSSPVQIVGGTKFSTMATFLATFPTTQLTMNAQGALDVNGNAWCWGSNTSGQCGNNSATAAFSSPVQVVGGHSFAQLFTFGDSQFNANAFYAIDGSGNLWAWGENRGGMLGTGNRLSQSSPVQIVFPVGAGAITKIMGFVIQSAAVSPPTMIAVLDNLGHMYTWGTNQNGLAGTNVAPTGANPTPPVTSSPVQVVGGFFFQNFFADQSLGGSSSSGSIFAVDIGGNIYSWGTNSAGELGVGDQVPRSSPTLIVGSGAFSQGAPQQVQMLDVVPGQAYAIVLQGAYSQFGSTTVGYGADQMTVEFEQ